jgi:hypothetical protein
MNSRVQVSYQPIIDIELGKRGRNHLSRQVFFKKDTDHQTG